MSAAAQDRLNDEIQARSNRGLLRFITCGSVDDGKSTLIGRLLYDSKLLLSDQIEAIRRPEKEEGFSFSSLVDGLEAEQEQGITIDVAYRYFATERRNFIVADTPGHEQYTRNMATGASTAELAILLVDARKGILPQTRRHAYIVSLLGIRDVVLAVNKMDLCNYAEDVFDEIRDAFDDFTKQLNIQTVQAIPMSALKGDNIVDPGDRMPWYDGPTLMSYLEKVRPNSPDAPAEFRFPVQWVNRPNQDFRGASGSVAAGSVSVGDDIVVLPSGVSSKLDRIVTFDGDKQEAEVGEAVTLVLADDVDVSRGDIICPRRARASISDQFEVKLIWMSDTELLPGRSYILKAGAQSATASVTKLKYRINIKTLEHEAAPTLKLNEIAECTISLDRLIAFDPYADIPALGSFILIDKENNATVAAGLIEFGLMRASNIHWQATDISKGARADLKGQRPCVIWFTGLSGSGKSTIANLLEKRLSAAARHSYLLDGDNVRHGLNRDLGFTDADRVENIRRVGEVAKLFVDSGMIVLVSFISPFRSERRMARDLVETGEFVEIFVDAPIEVCEARDTKGLYAKARAGEIKNFTGFDSPYEKPRRAELTLDTAALSAEESVEQIVDYLRQNGFVEFD